MVRGNVRFPERLSLSVIQYIAEEVERQGRGPIQVSWMADAWGHAAYTKSWHPTSPTLEDIVEFGRLIERDKNANGIRRVPVFIGYEEKLKAPLVEYALKSMLEHWKDMSPDQRYYEFETIHPFIDGNGRTGKILYNWESLERPTMPPNFWNVNNP